MDKLTEYFIKEPEREFHVRELSKLLKKSPTTISKYLKEYEKQGILLSQVKLNHLLFKANSTSAQFKQLKLNYNLSIIKSSKLLEHLEKEFNHPEAIILFGSFAKAENTKNSDIDILIITSNKKEIDLADFEKKMGNQIQLHISSHKEIELMKTKNKELLNNFINGIVLSGHWEIFK